MTALLGTSVTLEELIEVIGKHLRNEHWSRGADIDALLRHDFRDPRATTTIGQRYASDVISLRGSQVSFTSRYSGQERIWLSNGKIVEKLPADWRSRFNKALQDAAPDLARTHDLKARAFVPHNFIATIEWTAPAHLSADPRRLAIYGPMEAPEQINFIVDMIRRSISQEAPNVEEALQRARQSLLGPLEEIAQGQPLPEISWYDNPTKHGITTRATLKLLGTDLQHHTLTLIGHYTTPAVDHDRTIYAGDLAAIDSHYRYLEIYNKQNGMMRLTALAQWLCGRPDGTIQGIHKQFSKNLMGTGVVKLERKKGRLEASYKSDKLSIQTGKVSINLPGRFPETVIASLKGKPLGALLELDGISEHIIITSLAYDGNLLVGRLRDNSNLYLDGDIIVDKTREPTCT